MYSRKSGNKSGISQDLGQLPMHTPRNNGSCDAMIGA